MTGIDIFSTPPQAVNELGCKFWADRDSTDYAKRKGLAVQVVYVEHPDGSRTRLILENGEAVYENTSIEAIACHIDVLSFLNKSPATGKP